MIRFNLLIVDNENDEKMKKNCNLRLYFVLFFLLLPPINLSIFHPDLSAGDYTYTYV